MPIQPKPIIRLIRTAMFAAGIGGYFLTQVTAQPLAQQSTISRSCPNTIDYVDPTYRSRIRQMRKPDGHVHNIYYHRNPWSANNTYLIGVQTNVRQENWWAVLYDGEGCFINEIFPIDQYDWRLVWDLKDPKVLYTWKRSALYKYNVTTAKSELLKSFGPLNLALKPTGPSLNQTGDRILVITSDETFRSYHLPDMQDERTFKVAYPPYCSSVWRDERYIGYRNYIVSSCSSSDATVQAILVYDDTGALVHRFDGIGGGGHFDFSPGGQLAYLKMPSGPRGGPKTPLEIHVIDLDGTNNRVVYSVPASQTRYLQNLHLSWPDKVNNWFVASFFPSAENLPGGYAPPLDEILLITTSGEYKFLARTGTSVTRKEFWAQPLASPSSDGSRVSFNSNRSGTIDQYVLWITAPTQ